MRFDHHQHQHPSSTQHTRPGTAPHLSQVSSTLTSLALASPRADAGANAAAGTSKSSLSSDQSSGSLGSVSGLAGAGVLLTKDWQRMRQGMLKMVRRMSMARRFAPHLSDDHKSPGKVPQHLRGRRASVAQTPPASPRVSSPRVSTPRANTPSPSAGGKDGAG